MTQPSSEDLLRPYYESFEGKHTRLQSELLALLPEKGLSEKVVITSDHVNDRKPTRLTFQRLAIAALLFVSVGLSMLHQWGPSQPVYGMEHLAEQLLTIRSLHIKGWWYKTITTEEGEEKVEKYPVELYAQRPNYIGYRAYGFTDPGGGKPTRVDSSYTASDGKQLIGVSHNNKTAIITAMPSDPFYVELFVESQIQASAVNQFLQGPPEEYRKMRSEKIDDVLCDLYVFDSRRPQLASQYQASSSRHLVWLNPQTGIPVKVESYDINKEGDKELTRSEIIHVNVAPPSSLFSFRAPDGYKETRVDREDSADLTMKGIKLFPIGSGGSDTTWLATWHSFNINNRAALVCWSQNDIDQGEKQWFARQPKFELYQGDLTQSCREQTLATNKVGDTRWRWSLIFPEDKEPIGEALLRFSIRDKRTKTHQELKPLRFPRERLKEIIAEAQRRTLPDGEQSELFTLEQIESKL